MSEIALKMEVYRAKEALREFYEHFDAETWYPSALYARLWTAEWRLAEHQRTSAPK